MERAILKALPFVAQCDAVGVMICQAFSLFRPERAISVLPEAKPRAMKHSNSFAL